MTARWRGWSTKGVRGVTSNPSIFAKTLATSSAYDEMLEGKSDVDVEVLFEELAVRDVRDACDVLGSVHTARAAPSPPRNGATATASSRSRSRPGSRATPSPRSPRPSGLAAEVGRNNVMIKIPGDQGGTAGDHRGPRRGHQRQRDADLLPRALQRGHHGVDGGLELAMKRRSDVSSIGSVASFFVSRVDVAVDALLPEGDPRRGTTANAQVAGAYEVFRRRMASERAQALFDARRAGAAPPVGLHLDQEPGRTSTCSTSTRSSPTRRSTRCRTPRWPRRWTTATSPRRNCAATRASLRPRRNSTKLPENVSLAA